VSEGAGLWAQAEGPRLVAALDALHDQLRSADGNGVGGRADTTVDRGEP
jgi:hypothetical protein